MRLWSLPKGWKWTTLDEVVSIENKAVTPNEIEGRYKQFVGLENIEKDTGRLIAISESSNETIKSNKFVFDSDSILYGKLRPYLNKVLLPNFDGICSTDIIVLKPKLSKIDRHFLGAWMRHPIFVKEANNRSTGANLPRINPNVLIGMNIPVPPLDTQRKIVAILDKAEETKRLRAQANELTQKLLQSVFLEMFGDPLKNEKGMRIVNLQEICEEITVGIVVKPASYYVKEGVPTFRSLNIKPNKLVPDNLVFVSSSDNDTVLSKSKLHGGDVLAVRTGYPGTACVVPDGYEGANCIDLIIMRPNKALVNCHYLSYFLNSAYGKAQSLAGNTGLAQQHLNISKLRRIQIPLPPLSMQNQFALSVEQVVGFLDQQQSSTTLVVSLFDTLMASAFNGELVA